MRVMIWQRMVFSMPYEVLLEEDHLKIFFSYLVPAPADASREFIRHLRNLQGIR